MGIEISLLQLKAITDRLFESLGERGDSIELQCDDYWEVLPSERFVLGDLPPKLGVGKLSDDLAFLQPLLTTGQDAIPYMFVHLAPLLSAIAEATIPKD